MKLLHIAFAAAALSWAGAAQAGPSVTVYDDHAAFSALGAITQVTNFDSYNENDFTVVGDPLTVGHLSIESEYTGVFGKQSYQIVRNGLANDYATNLTVTIDQPGFNLFSYAIGAIGGNAYVTVSLYTNNGFAYAYGVKPFPAQEGYKFQGLLAPDGEYFTKAIFHPNDDQTYPAFSEFELGHTTSGCNSPTCPGGGAVPEPSVWGLMILGFGATGAALRRRRGRVEVLA